MGFGEKDVEKIQTLHFFIDMIKTFFSQVICASISDETTCCTRKLISCVLLFSIRLHMYV